MKKNLPLIILAIFIIAAGSFYGGMLFGKSKKSFGPGNPNGMPNFRNGNNSANGQRNSLISGEIISQDDKSITLKLKDNGSKIIFYSSSTKISKTVTGTATDLTTGANIMVTGTTNDDGSVVAENIDIRPAGWQPNNGNNTPPTNTNTVK